MSSCSNDKFNVEKWNEALVVASKIVAKRLIGKPVDKQETSESTSWLVSSSDRGISVSVIFACDITATSGTYPTFDKQATTGKYHVFGMSQDVFDRFTSGATIVMKRLVSMIIKEYDSSQENIEIAGYSGFETSHTTSDATVVTTYLKARTKTTEVAQSQPGLLSWFRSSEPAV